MSDSKSTVEWSSGQIISLWLFTLSAIMALVVFWLARGDHDMKLLALGSVLGFIAGSSGTASTLLVGKAAASSTGSQLPDVSTLTPGGSATTTQTVQAPPAVPPTPGTPHPDHPIGFQP